MQLATRNPQPVTRKLTLLLIFLLFAVMLSAQSRQDLTNKRKRLLAEIGRASQLLSSTKRNKAAALDQYYTLQRQVRQRRQLVETLYEEIDLSNESIERTSSTIEALQADMERLEKEYAEMARQAYRSKMTDSKLLFLFSADGLSDGLKRWRYIQQYDEYRNKQAGLILETKSSLADKLAVVELKKVEQEELLAVAKRQQTSLSSELRLKNQILNGLKADEHKISSLINQKRRAHRQLSKAIENIVRAEINSRPSNSKKNKTDSKPNISTSSNSVSIAKLTQAFRKQKSRLSWPVKNGVVIRHFGKQAHPIHKNIMITNNGIDIKATVNNKVVAIFNGTVAGFQYVPGYQNTLIIQHGDYYSVYSNLQKINVKKGDAVKAGQLLGLAGISSQHDYLEVHLEIWKGKQRLNPAVWLSR